MIASADEHQVDEKHRRAGTAGATRATTGRWVADPLGFFGAGHPDVACTSVTKYRRRHGSDPARVSPVDDGGQWDDHEGPDGDDEPPFEGPPAAQGRPARRTSQNEGSSFTTVSMPRC